MVVPPLLHAYIFLFFCGFPVAYITLNKLKASVEEAVNRD